METLSQVWATLYAYRQLIGTLAMVFGPSLVRRGIRFVHARNHPHGPAPVEPPLSPLILLIVGMHLAYAAYSLYVPGYDVFRSHKLKIRAPNDLVRATVLRAAGIAVDDLEASPYIAALLARLSTLDGRYAYVRWGHATFVSGMWCRDMLDYALAAVPHLLTPYVLEALVIGVMGWQAIGGPGAHERKRRFRAAAGWALGAMLAVDFGSRCMLEIRAGPDNDCLHLDTTLHTFRTIALFLTTASYAFLPLPQDARAAEATTVRTLEAALNTQRLALLAREAVARSPAMHRLAGEVRNNKAHAEDVVRADPQVVAAAQAAGIWDGNDYAPQLRASSQNWIRAQWARTVRR